jgi:hypothetical protein
MKLKIPFITKSKYIDVHVYVEHAAIDKCNFLEATSKIEKDLTKPTSSVAPTTSTCASFLAMQKRSFTLKSWQDWSIDRPNRGDFNANLTRPELCGFQGHSSEATNGWSGKHNMDVIKIRPPFKVETEDSIDWVQTYSPFAHQNIRVPSGIVNFKYSHETNFFIYNYKTDTESIKFKAGDILLNYIPLSNRRVKIHQHYDPDRYDYLHKSNAPLTIKSGYIKKKLFMQGSK